MLSIRCAECRAWSLPHKLDEGKCIDCWEEYVAEQYDLATMSWDLLVEVTLDKLACDRENARDLFPEMRMKRDA